ncbi:MAG: DUF4174 domain-containing protein [Verrucomicrobia bacterium]|nr:DUF4174 domain-containing protein [Verrucomicrobiota bacterium]
MKNRLLLLLAVFAFSQTHAEVVRPAPDFTWGPGKTLKSWKGQPVVLLIAPSPKSSALRKQADRIQAVYQEFAARNAVFVAAFTDPETADQSIPSNVPFVVANNGAQIAANYGFEGKFAVVVIGKDGNLDLNSAKVVPASRIMDMILNNYEQQAAERKP